VSHLSSVHVELLCDAYYYVVANY